MGKYLIREEVIKRLQNIYGDRFDFSNIDYKGNKHKIKLYCKKHGWFEQYVNVLYKGMSCPKCGIERRSNERKYNTVEYLSKCRNVWDNKYDLTKIEYNGCYEKITPICKKHGMFSIAAYSFLQGHGCPKCATEINANKMRFTTDDCVNKFIKVHGNSYDYSDVEYNGMDVEVKIKCPRHGIFLQKPKKHIQGHGCPYCNQSRLEDEVRKALIKRNIQFKEQKTFEWLKSKKHLRIDFFLPHYKVAIECQGIQHFVPTNFGGKLTEDKMKSAFNDCIERDRIKRNMCLKNGIKMIYYSNIGIKYPYDVYEDINILIHDIVGYE